MEIFLSSIYALILAYIILKSKFFKIADMNPMLFVAIFFVKLIAAMALTWIYTCYYTDRSTADIYKYFDDGKMIFSAFKHHPYDYFRMITGINSDAPELKHYYLDCNHWFKKFDYMMYNDNRTIIRFNAFVMLFSFGNFFVHNVLMSFLSLVGLTAVFKVFVTRYPEKRIELLLVIFLLPSTLLWTSAALKEGLVVFALGLFFYALWQILYDKFKIKYMVICITMFYILILAKYYVIACAAPGFLFLVLKKYFPNKRSWILLLSIALFCLAIIIAGHLAGGVFDVINTLTYKQNDFVNYSLSLSDVGSLMDTYKLKPTMFDFIVNSPKALFNSLFKPLPWDVHNPMAILPAMENVLLLILIIVCVVYRKNNPQANTLVLFSLCFVICLNVLNGLIVPVYGALVRYKVPALPFLFGLLVCIPNLSIGGLFRKIPKD